MKITEDLWNDIVDSSSEEEDTQKVSKVQVAKKAVSLPAKKTSDSSSSDSSDSEDDNTKAASKKNVCTILTTYIQLD